VNTINRAVCHDVGDGMSYEYSTLKVNSKRRSDYIITVTEIHLIR